MTEKRRPDIPGKSDVVIIGAGPVGLTASLLLSKYQVPHLIADQRSRPTDHPQAHFISCRAMEIFREIDGLEDTIRGASAPLEEWRHYVYCTDIYNLPKESIQNDRSKTSLLGVVDHFPNGPDHDISPTWECNLPQHVLIRLLRKAAVRHEYCRLLEGYRAEVSEDNGAAQATLFDVASNRAHAIESRFIVCADGAHSESRKSLGIRRRRKTPVLQHLINVHFISPDLADLLRQRIMGMLYFVYSPAGIGVFVNHSLKQGEFVLQLPYFPPHQHAEQFTASVCRDIITALVGTSLKLDIKDIRPWRLRAWVAERFYSESGRCFLVGDAAHQVLPAGGFGLNCGIADAHNLAWKLARMINGEKDEKNQTSPELLLTYDAERRPVAERYLDISKKNFKKPLAVSSAIGLDWRAAKWLDRFIRLTPVPNFLRRTAFGLGMKIGLSQVKLLQTDNLVGNIRRKDVDRIFSDPSKTLQMRFPRHDLGVVYRQGWLEGKSHTDFYRTENTAFTPALVKGARLPHFWLNSTKGSEADPISAIDLPDTAAKKHGRPVYVLLSLLLPAEAAKRLRREVQTDFTPIEVVRIGETGSSQKPEYRFCHAPPPFLKSPTAVLIRPDGHIAWMRQNL